MICENCVINPSMKLFVQQSGLSATCDYCKTTAICIDDTKLYEFMFDRACNALLPIEYMSYYEQTMIFNCGVSEPRVFPLWEFFEDFAQFAVDPFMEYVQEVLPDEKVSSGGDRLYALNDGHLDENNEFESRWHQFIGSIRHDKRFFNHEAKKFCEDLFAAICEGDELNTELIYELKESDSIFRARIAYNTENIKAINSDPVSQLGPVPKEFATSQRMTPTGVSAFYGAFDRNTCLSELRPIVGDAVVSGEFKPNRNLRLLDLNALTSLPAPQDFFASDYLQKSHAIAFFHELVFQLTRPSSRNGHHDYLATQVVFEYLGMKFGHQVHGIKYSSVQKNGGTDCISLFPEHSLVNEGVYCIEEPHIFSEKQAALYFVPDSLRFHRVKSVTYEGSEHDSDHDLTMNDGVLRKLFPEMRY